MLAPYRTLTLTSRQLRPRSVLGQGEAPCRQEAKERKEADDCRWLLQVEEKINKPRNAGSPAPSFLLWGLGFPSRLHRLDLQPKMRGCFLLMHLGNTRTHTLQLLWEPSLRITCL